MCNLEYKKSIIESTLASAKLYYDDRIKNIESDELTATITTTTTSGLGTTATNTNNPEIVNGSKSQIYSLFGLKRRMSSSSTKKNKSSTTKKSSQSVSSTSSAFQELKIKEDGEIDLNVNSNGEQPEDELLDENLETEAELETILSSVEMNANEKAAILVGKIDRSVQTLDRLWQELNRQALTYNNLMVNFYNNLQQMQKSFECVQQKLNENETQAGQINVVNQIESDKLADELEKVKNFQLKISSYQPLIDNMCSHYTNVMQELQSCSEGGDGEDLVIRNRAQANIRVKYEDLNQRWSNLQNQLQENYLHLYSLIESSGADIFIKLADSVQTPWQRAVSANNKIPYYIK